MKKIGVGCHQFLVLAVSDKPFPVEIIQDSKFKVTRLMENVVWSRPPLMP